MKSSFVFDALFPPRCCGCDSITENNLPVCAECKKLVLHPSKSRNSCDICGFDIKNCICKKHQFYQKLITCFYYTDAPVKTIFRMKFRSRPDIAKNYAKLIHLCLLERGITEDIDIITFVPMRKFARFKRGYNQSELLAKYLSFYTDKPCMKLVDKKYASSSQHKLGAVSRTGNLLGCFEPTTETIPLFKDKTVLVVDDVFTTGSTFNEISKTLLIFGADSVFAAACTATKKKKYIEQKKQM